MKVAIYARVSTKDQNVQMQLDLCRKYCEFGKHEIYKEYVDIGESGSKESRPAFDEMLADMRRYKFNTVCVYKMDRIGRSLAHLMKLFEEFKNRSVHFVSITQNIDSSSPEGRMFMQLMMVLAEYEKELTVDRVHAGIERARRQGKRLGRPPNDVDRFAILRLRNEGLSMRKIASQLNYTSAAVQRCIKRYGVIKE